MDSWLISKDLRMFGGVGCLFSKVVNANKADSERRRFTTGTYSAATLLCSGCDEELGWIYEDAEDVKNKFKLLKCALAEHRIRKTKRVPVPQQSDLAFAPFWNCKRYADVEFDVDGEIIFAHAVVLAARSEYFRAQFDSGMEEALIDQGRKGVRVPIISSDVFDNKERFKRVFTLLLRYLYAADVPSDTPAAQLVDLFILADKYMVVDLKELCASRLPSALQCSDVLETFSALNAYPWICGNLFPPVVWFILSNWSKLKDKMATLPPDDYTKLKLTKQVSDHANEIRHPSSAHGVPAATPARTTLRCPVPTASRVGLP